MKFTKDMKMEDIPPSYRGAFGKWLRYHAKPLDEVFWSKVKKLGPDDCWEWQGGRQHERGHGLFYIRGGKFDQMLSHRMAWIFTNGHIPDGMCICHKCDNPPCCNPAHLFVGTQADNVYDMISKGRKVQVKGEQSGTAKLTERQVIEIRKRYHPGKTTHAILAREFGVSKSHIRQIIIRGKWSHV